MSRIVRIAALGCGLVGGVAASQAPEFAQQYRQRLGGAIDELTRVVARFDGDAQAGGQSRADAIARLRGNGDDLTRRQGAAMEANAERLSHLEDHRRGMAAAGPFARIGLMARDGDADVLGAAYRDFEPAMQVTNEGLVSAGTGFVLVWGGILLLAGFIGRSLRPRRRGGAKGVTPAPEAARIRR